MTPFDRCFECLLVLAPGLWGVSLGASYGVPTSDSNLAARCRVLVVVEVLSWVGFVLLIAGLICNPRLWHVRVGFQTASLALWPVAALFARCRRAVLVGRAKLARMLALRFLIERQDGSEQAWMKVMRAMERAVAQGDLPPAALATAETLPFGMPGLRGHVPRSSETP